MSEETCQPTDLAVNRWFGRLILACFVGLCGLGGTNAAAPGEAAPAAPVEALHAELMTVMRAGQSLGFRERLQHLLPVVEDAFDLPLMTQVSVGSTWRSLDDAERALLVSLFSHFTAASYAANFDDYSGQRFELVATHVRRADRAVVETRLFAEAGGRDPVELHYLLQKTGDDWRVIDVLLKGRISQLAARRSEFASILRRKGASGLAETLREKIDKLSDGPIPEDALFDSGNS